MRKILYFFLYSNIFVALGATFLTLYTYDLLVLKSNKLIICLFVFFSTLLAYNFQRIFKQYKEPFINDRGRWLHNNKNTALFLTFISFIISIVLLLMLPQSIILLLIPLTLISTWYAIGIVKKDKKHKPLREIPLLKIFLIAIVWVGTCYILPVIQEYSYSALKDYRVQFIAMAFGAYVFALTLPFDIRDLKIDREKNLLTFPNKIGIYKTKILSYVLFIIAVILFFFIYSIGFISIIPFVVFIASSLISILLVSFVTIESKSLYYDLILESCLMLPFVFSQILNLIL